MFIASQRRVSYQRAGEIYRAIECRTVAGDRPVTIEEAESFRPSETFGGFIEVNCDTMQLFEEPRDYAEQIRHEAFDRESDWWRCRGFSEEAAAEIATFAVRAE
jgi:hypothetical protein